MQSCSLHARLRVRHLQDKKRGEYLFSVWAVLALNTSCGVCDTRMAVHPVHQSQHCGNQLPWYGNSAHLASRCMPQEVLIVEEVVTFFALVCLQLDTLTFQRIVLSLGLGKLRRIPQDVFHSG